MPVQSWLQANNNTGILNTCTRLWLTESEQATPVDSIKDVARSSVKVSRFDKHLKKAGGHIGQNVVEITIKMKTIVQKALMIKIIKLRLRFYDNKHAFSSWDGNPTTVLQYRKVQQTGPVLFFWFVFFNGISTFGRNLMPKTFLKNSGDSIYPIPGRIQRFMPFPRDISPKVNVIVQLEFEIASYDVTIQYISRYITVTSSCGDNSSTILSSPPPSHHRMVQCVYDFIHKLKLFEEQCSYTFPNWTS